MTKAIRHDPLFDADCKFVCSFLISTAWHGFSGLTKHRVGGNLVTFKHGKKIFRDFLIKLLRILVIFVADCRFPNLHNIILTITKSSVQGKKKCKGPFLKTDLPKSFSKSGYNKIHSTRRCTCFNFNFAF